MSKDKTSYLVRDIDSKMWKKFRGLCYLNGYNSAGECLSDFIKKYVDGGLGNNFVK